MKRTILIAITLLLAIGCAKAQLVVVTQTTQEVTIGWEHSGLDVLGNTENLVGFRIWYQHNDGDTVWAGITPMDTMEYTLTLPDTTGKYVLGVSAVDRSGNESAIHFSTDPTASLGGWYLLFDIVMPSLPFNLMRIR